MKTVIFDLDGTLICSHEDVWSCLATALQPFELAIPPEIRADNRLLAKSAGEILKMIYPDATTADCEQYASDVHHLYADECVFTDTYLYSGIYELLLYLANNGYRLLVVTMKPEVSARNVMSSKGIEHFFTGIYSPDSYPPEKLKKSEVFQKVREQYNLGKENCLTVGDSISDVIAAHEAALAAIAVGWGYSDYQVLEKSQAEALVTSVTELKFCILNEFARYDL